MCGLVVDTVAYTVLARLNVTAYGLPVDKRFRMRPGPVAESRRVRCFLGYATAE